MNDIAVIWAEVLSGIKNQIPQSEFQTWFNHISLADEKEGSVILSVLNVFEKNKILSSYKSLIEREFANLGKNVSVSVITKPDSVNNVSLHTQNIRNNNSFSNEKRDFQPFSYTQNENPSVSSAFNSSDMNENSDKTTPAQNTDYKAQSNSQVYYQTDNQVSQASSQTSSPAVQAQTAAQTNKEPVQPNSTLNPSYTFESFVPGDNSMLVYNACLVISKNPGNTYNPCLIYGGVGLGKTHLIQSIGNAIYNNNPKKKILYTTTENFTNDFFENLSQNSMNVFRNKYRKVSVLLIDDIQFLSGKTPKLQEELFNTFNDLYDTGQQLVFTCDRPIEELKDITERLRSRFTRGFYADIQPPSYETRLAIIQRKCAMQNFNLSREIMDFIATNIIRNVRDLESCITKLKGYCELIKDPPLSLEKAKDLLKNNIFYSTDTTGIKMDEIIKAVADSMGVEEEDIKGTNRSKKILKARQIAMYLCTKILGENTSSTEIAREFGGKNHTSVLHNVEKIEQELKDPNNTIQSIIERLTEQIKLNSKK